MGRRLFVYFSGLAITALGAVILILSGVGTGPFDAMAVGMNRLFGLTIGMWAIIIQTFLVMLISIIEKKPPQVGAFMALMIRSWIIDFWFYIVFKQADFTATWMTQWFSFLIGLFAMGVGIAIYIKARFPKSPVDGLMVAVHERFGWSLSTSRIIIEMTAVIISFFIGGPVGIGTVIIAISLGKIIQFSNYIIDTIKLIIQTIRDPKGSVHDGTVKSNQSR